MEKLYEIKEHLNQEHKIHYIEKITILMDVVFPILYIFEGNEEYTIGYTVEYKQRKGKFELLLIPTTSEKIKQIIHGEISILDIILENEECLYVHFLTRENKIIVFNIHPQEYRAILPAEQFTLNSTLVNKVDIEKLKLEWSKR